MPGATPVYGLPYPISTDRLDDAVTTIPQSLALAVESTVAANSGTGAPTAWTAPTFAGTWTSLGGGIAPVRYRKVGSLVHLRGTLTTPGAQVAGADLFTLPAGFRPTAGTVIFACAASVGYARVDVTTTGLVEVQVAIGAAGFLSLDNVRFFID